MQLVYNDSYPFSGTKYDMQLCKRDPRNSDGTLASAGEVLPAGAPSDPTPTSCLISVTVSTSTSGVDTYVALVYRPSTD